jgi:hypothetical protein
MKEKRTASILFLKRERRYMGHYKTKNKNQLRWVSVMIVVVVVF